MHNFDRDSYASLIYQLRCHRENLARLLTGKKRYDSKRRRERECKEAIRELLAELERRGLQPPKDLA